MTVSVDKGIIDIIQNGSNSVSFTRGCRVVCPAAGRRRFVRRADVTKAGAHFWTWQSSWTDVPRLYNNSTQNNLIFG